MKPGRNNPCICGSGKKYKHCCEGKVAPRAAAPAPDEFNQLVGLYNARRYAELESKANALLGRYPDSGFAWKLLGAALQMQGKHALAAFQKTAQLMPADAEAHFNLGVVQKSLGLLDDAVASYQRALKINPAYAEAHGNLGNVLKDLGQTDEAVASYRQAIRLKPNSADAHNNLGTALRDLGNLDEAIESYRRAIAINPNYFDAYYNLGNVQKDAGQPEDAIASYRKVIAMKPGFADAHMNMGATLKNIGQLEAATSCYRKVIELKPESAKSYYLLGNVLRETGKLDDAMTSYHRSLEFKPEFFDAHYSLGKVQVELGLFESAVASFHRALEINPDTAVTHSYLGHALKGLGQLDDAVHSYQRALEIDPKCVGAMLGLGYLYATNGETKKTDEVYRKVLEVDADNLSAHFMLANVRKAQPGDTHLSALLAAAEAARNGQSPMPNNQAVSLQFALGKSFDDMGDHHRAFPHFLEGCKLKRATFKYDAAQMTRYFKEVMRIFEPATIDRLRGGGNPSNVPIFVLGMPRSGTTLIEQVIASHPEVYGAGELSDLAAITQRDVSGKGGYPGNLLALDRERLAQWGDDYVAGLRARAPDARHITDKMPGNFLFIGLIYLMLPNAKIIHVNRNPVDTCLSCFTKLFVGAQKQTYDLAELGQYYVDYARLMDHWRKILPAGAFLDVQYEDIVADQETQARRLIAFCGLEWNDACIDFHKHRRSVNTASLMQVRQPIYNSSIERWRPYEQYLGPLLDALGDLAPKRTK